MTDVEEARAKWVGKTVRVMGAETRGVVYNVEWDTGWRTWVVYFTTEDGKQQMGKLDYHLIREQ